MSPTNMTRSRGQVHSIGNYLMTGKVLGKGHFARVEEATHRLLGKKVAIKVIDLTCIKEEYARRNLHREPRVMARLSHPCIAALYETMMHGPRLYVVMEAAGGGDLCAHVLAARGPARGLPEPRARALACQLVSAVRHMHARGVVHRDLKMENIMLDHTKQFIKIVDFGLSNVWTRGGALRTPCGSLEYAAPELFVDGRRYGPEVDLWSIGVIVYGTVTGGLPFTAAEGGGGGGGGASAGKSRPLLRAAIARGFTRKQRAALACVSAECKAFIQHLLEPNVEQRLKIEEAARHRWLRRPGLRLKTHPLAAIEPRANREIHHQISDLSGETALDVAARIKADPFGPIGGLYNIKTHLLQLQVPGADLLWSSTPQDPRPATPPEYKKTKFEERPDTAPSGSKSPSPATGSSSSIYNTAHRVQLKPVSVTQPFQKLMTNGLTRPPGIALKVPSPARDSISLMRSLTSSVAQATIQSVVKAPEAAVHRTKPAPSPRFHVVPRPLSVSGVKKPAFKTMQNSGDFLDRRLPRIEEHSGAPGPKPRPCRRRASPERSPARLASCPPNIGEIKRSEFYRKAGDGLPSWRASGAPAPARLLLQTTATTIKRASLGSIVSPHSSTNSHCKSERSAPVGWWAARPALAREPPHLQRFRRAQPLT